MKSSFIYLLFFVLLSCSQAKTRYLPESMVLKMHERKYDTLRVVLKDSLSKGIVNVNDYDEVYSSAEKQYLDSLIVDFKRKTGVQIILFTFDSLMTSEDSVEVATQIIGIKNRINITIGFSFSNKFIAIWNDSTVNNSFFRSYEAKTMIDEKFIPVFKTGDLYKGTVDGLQAMMQRIANNKKYSKQ